MWQFLMKLTVTIGMAILAVPYVTARLYPIAMAYLAPESVHVKIGDTGSTLLQNLIRLTPREQWPELLGQLNDSSGDQSRAELISLTRAANTLGPNEGILEALRKNQVVEKRLAGQDERPGYARYMTGSALYVRLGDSEQVLHIESFPSRYSADALVILDFAVWSVRGVFIVLVLLLWLMPLRKSIRELKAAAQHYGDGDFSYRIKMSRMASLYPLASTMGAMAERIGALLNARRELTNSVAHDLRTPLNRLRFSCQLAMDENTAKVKDHHLRQIGADVNELEATLSDLLTYARLEGARCEIELESFPVLAWIGEQAENARRLAAASERDVAFHWDSKLSELYADRRLLSRAIANLVANATRHAKKNVEIKIARVGATQKITVDDDGMGIAERDRLKIFEPFSRLDEARSRDSGGDWTGFSNCQPDIEIARRGDCCIGLPDWRRAIGDVNPAAPRA